MKKNIVKITGTVRGWVEDKNTGLMVPGSYFEKENTIQNALLYYLAYKIGTDTTDRALDSLFAASGTQAAYGGTADGNDGIVHGTAATDSVNYILDTDKNAGGDETEAYIEFYGEYDGAATLTGYLQLGSNYVNASTALTKVFSSVSVNTTVSAGQKFHYYWKLTLS